MFFRQEGSNDGRHTLKSYKIRDLYIVNDQDDSLFRETLQVLHTYVGDVNPELGLHSLLHGKEMLCLSSESESGLCFSLYQKKSTEKDDRVNRIQGTTWVSWVVGRLRKDQ